jgi:hypothetical protein
MGRRAHNNHFDTGKTKTTSWGSQEAIALCGEAWTFRGGVVTDEARVSCSKCAKLLAQQKMGPDFPVRVEKIEHKGYRFAYAAYLNDEHIGYIVYDGGYASGRWYIAAIRLNAGDAIDIGHQLDDQHARYPKAVPYRSKENAMLEIPALAAAERLKTTPTLIREQAEWEIELERRGKENARKKAEAAQAREETAMGLQEIIALQEAGAISLSNFQITALQNALKACL